MKQTRIWCFVGALVFMASPVPADISVGSVTQTRTDGYFAGAGGEFTFSGAGVSNAAYAPGTRGQGGDNASFQTFCVEYDEYVAGSMMATVSTTWTSGAVPQWSTTGDPVSPRSHAVRGGEEFGDDLNPQTAYIYHQWATGQLFGYDYDGLSAGDIADEGLGRSVDAGQLQNLIWYFEGEQDFSDLTGPDVLAWAQDAVDATGLVFGTDLDAPSGNASWGATIGDVRILNMMRPDGGGGYIRGQDQLYMVPVPAALLLGMIGIGMVGVARRRLR